MIVRVIVQMSRNESSRKQKYIYDFILFLISMEIDEVEGIKG